jgi:hypothetical protein
LRRPYEKEKEEEKPSVTLPPIVSWFVGTLPESTKFDGRCQPPIPCLPPALSTRAPCYRSSVQNGRPITSFSKRRHSKCQPTEVPHGPSPTMYVFHCSSPRGNDADHPISP